MSYRPTCLIRAPIATRSGYGEKSKDMARQIIEYQNGKFDVMIDSINWGHTPMDSLDPNDPRDKMLLDRIVKPENITERPDLYVSISVPTEFRPFGRYNIGITAGVETNLASPKWVAAMNVMDVNVVVSKHSRDTFLRSAYQQQDPNGNVMSTLKCEKPIEIIGNTMNTKIFKKIPKHELDKEIRQFMDDQIETDFNFIFVGHWMKGGMGEDRKNVGRLVQVFLDVFKRSRFSNNRPGLILKVSGGQFSLIDREDISRKIREIRNSIELEEGEEFPKIYLVHGDLTDFQMASLYNHPKVKANVSFTHGEGFGRPLIEGTACGLVTIAPGWSGQLDFLDKDRALLIGGSLVNIPDSVVWEDVLIKEARWIEPDYNMAAGIMVEAVENYAHWKKQANSLGKENSKNFSYNAMKKKMHDLLDTYVPEFEPQAKTVQVKMPGADEMPAMELPSLKRIK